MKQILYLWHCQEQHRRNCSSFLRSRLRCSHRSAMYYTFSNGRCHNASFQDHPRLVRLWLCDCFKGDIFRLVLFFYSQKFFDRKRHFLKLELVLDRFSTALTREKLRCSWYGRKVFVTGSGEAITPTGFPDEHYQYHPSFMRSRLQCTRKVMEGGADYFTPLNISVFSKIYELFGKPHRKPWVP